MAFYFTELEYEIRQMLQDTDSSNYRYGRILLESFAVDAVREIRRARPDAQLGSTGTITDFTGLYSYAESAQASVLDEFYRITGWDKQTYPVVYLKATAADTVDVYPTATDRNIDTNEFARISGMDSTGIKRITVQHASGWGGMVLATAAAVNTVKWNITATEVDMTLDDSLRMAVQYYVVYKCFELDSEELGDSNRAAQYKNAFLGSLGV